jgi:hypothetical protein
MVSLHHLALLDQNMPTKSISVTSYAHQKSFPILSSPIFKVLIFSFFECVQLLLIALSLVGGEFCVTLQLNLQAIYPEQSLLHHLLCLRHLDKKWL